MKEIKCITFDKTAQDNLPQHIKDKMNAKRRFAEKEQNENTIKIGNKVLYVGTYKGIVLKDRTVRLEDGAIIGSLDSQPHKFVKIV